MTAESPPHRIEGADFRYGQSVRFRGWPGYGCGLIPGISFGREPSNSTDVTFTRVASGFPGAPQHPTFKEKFAPAAIWCATSDERHSLSKIVACCAHFSE
jgi:hypothetical protein